MTQFLKAPRLTQERASRDSRRARAPRPVLGRPWRRFPLILAVSAALLALLAIVRGPIPALQLVALLLAFVLAIRRPEYVLAVGVAGTLAGGDSGTVSVVSSVLLLLGACASVFAMVTRRLDVRWQRIGLPLIVLLWLGFRVLLERDLLTASAVVQCVAVLVIVLHCLQARRDVVLAMAFGGMTFTAASGGLGVENLSGTRFEGISGNPNRMAFGLLIYLPFFFAVLVRPRHRHLRFLFLASIAGAVALVILSDSEQGITGLAVILIVLVLCRVAALQPALRAMTVLFLAAGLVVVIDIAARTVGFSSNLQTLSGRTSIYAAALREIGRHPLVGSGQQHLSERAAVDISAHSVVLGLAATGGVLLATLWIAVIAMLLATTVALIKGRSPLAAAPAALFTIQLVQSVQFVPITWAVIAMFLIARNPGELSGRPTNEADRGGGAILASTHEKFKKAQLPVRAETGWQS